MRMRGGSEPLPFSWDELVPLLVHPLRVAIIEALRHIGEPLSTADLKEIFDGRYALSLISYHLVTLAKVEAIVVVSQGQVRGSTERLYFLPDEG
jgi:DNA-binding transcriptional ArsR family regulator